MKKMSMPFGRALLVLALMGLGLASCDGGGSEEPKTNAGVGQDSKAVQASAKQPKLDEAAKREMEKDCLAFLQHLVSAQVALDADLENDFGYQTSDVTGIERLALMGFRPFTDVAFNTQIADKGGFAGFVGHALAQGSPIYYYAGEGSFVTLEPTSVMPSGIKIPTTLTVFELNGEQPNFKVAIVKTCQVNGVTVGACTTP